MVEVLMKSKSLRHNYCHSFILVIGLFLLSCEKPIENKRFTLLPSSHTGVTFSNELVSDEQMNILEYLYFYNGGGVALGDVNNDGLLDIYFTSNQGENKLYLNKGDFQFEDITSQANVDGGGGWSTGVTMADVNGDGLLDIYVCQVGGYKGIRGKNKLYINQGDLTFKEEAAVYGLDFEGFSTHAVFFDYDQDGDLDLYLLNHSIKKPEVFSHADTKFGDRDLRGGDKLFQSQVAQGSEKMLDVTEEAGILSSSLGFGLGVGIGDVNGNGWLDIYVSNDFTEDDYLYLNQGDGTFKESLKEMISHTSRYSMGNDLNDLNNDGFPEIFTTDMLPENPEIWMKSIGEDKQEVYEVKKKFGYGDQYVRNHLQLNVKGKRFAEVGLLTQTFATDWSWSPLIFDMDNDGLKDIHVTNGIVKRPNDLDFVQYSQAADASLTERELYEKLIKMLPSMKLANYTFRQTGGLEFVQMAESWGLDQLSYSSGSAYGDLDNDGDLDLVINNIDQEAFIYRNNTAKIDSANYIAIALQQDGFNVFGIGAKVMVETNQGEQYQLISPSRGFQSSSTYTAHFGLGKSNVIKQVQIHWNYDEVERFDDIAINQSLILQKGKGRPLSPLKENESKKTEDLFSTFPWIHEENTEFDDMRREYLLPRKYSTEGPALAVGDVNGDGLEDIYLGGAKGQASKLFLQTKSGDFVEKNNPTFDQMTPGEDLVAQLIDLNGNGFLDLYVGSGGYEHPQGHLYNTDRVFFNDGNGNFSFSPNSLPPIGENTSSIAIHDVNNDGAPDIFVASAVLTGNYGAKPKSYLLINDGNGNFTDQTEKFFGDNPDFGMIQSAHWQELGADDQKCLILAGEWSDVQIWKQSEDLTFQIAQHNIPTGMYLVADELGDWKNQPVIFLGNMGLNSKWKASKEKPLWLYHHDFDENGQEDPLVFHYMKDLLVPFGSRDDLIKQVPAVKKKHASYLEYSKIQKPEDVFGKDKIGAARKFQVTNMASGLYFVADGEFVSLPLEGQFGPVQSVYSWKEAEYLNLVVVGGFDNYRNDLGKSSALSMAFFQMNKEGKWIQSQLIPEISGQFRVLAQVNINQSPHLIGLRNNDSPVIISLEKLKDRFAKR